MQPYAHEAADGKLFVAEILLLCLNLSFSSDIVRFTPVALTSHS